jgi:hypothetical protein
MKFIYEVGDVVKIREDWRDWKVGEVAKIVNILEGNYGLQNVILENGSKHMYHTLSIYQIEPVFDVKKQ